MRILMVTHIGETLGHLVRALAVADELTDRGCIVGFAASGKAETLLRTWRRSYTRHPVRWAWSHNACAPETLFTSSVLHCILESASDVLELMKKVKPDLIVGFPGLVSTQAARHLGIPHISILHAPYLAPLVNLKKPTPAESTVIELTKAVCSQSVNAVFWMLSRIFGVPHLTYDEYLRTEVIYVPQPGLELPRLPNIHQVNFIRASFGAPVDLQGLDMREVDLAETCYITFGSGNPCDISRIIELTRTVFPSVIVTTGYTPLRNLPKGVVAKQFIASSSLAGRVEAVICHGGIGTVGTFAEHGTPQLIIPTEPDQATMVIHATRLGIARQCGLDSWAARGKLGRWLPHLSEEEFVSSLHVLRHRQNIPRKVEASGASEIACDLVYVSSHSAEAITV